MDGEAPVGPLARADRLALCRKTQIRVCNFYVYEYTIRRWKRGRIPRIFRSAAPPTVVFKEKNIWVICWIIIVQEINLRESFETCHRECCMSKSEGLNYIRQVSRRCNTRNGTFFPAYFLQSTMEKGLPSSAIEKLS